MAYTPPQRNVEILILEELVGITNVVQSCIVVSKVAQSLLLFSFSTVVLCQHCLMRSCNNILELRRGYAVDLGSTWRGTGSTRNAAEEMSQSVQASGRQVAEHGRSLHVRRFSLELCNVGTKCPTARDLGH